MELECPDGFEASGSALCAAVDDAPESEVGYSSVPVCARVTCAAMEGCSPDSVFGDECTLACEPGFAAAGRDAAVLTCDGEPAVAADPVGWTGEVCEQLACG